MHYISNCLGTYKPTLEGNQAKVVSEVGKPRFYNDKCFGYNVCMVGSLKRVARNMPHTLFQVVLNNCRRRVSTSLHLVQEK